MKWLLIVAGIFVLIILALFIIGLFQPIKHSVTRSIHLKQKPEAVFALLDNATNLTNWSPGIAKVEPLPDQNGKPAMRCTLKWGNMQMIMVRLERTPPTRLVTSMAKENGPTFGTWTYQIDAENDGCRVSLTEDGELKNPLYRIMARMRGLDSNISQTLGDLAKNFGENAPVRPM